MIGAIISGAANLIGGAATNVTNAHLADKEFENNMKMAEWQHDKNIELWNMNNAYNDPKAQMQRLSNAGLNPNLVYGSGAVGNTSSTAAPAKAPTYRRAEMQNILPSLLSTYQDFKAKEAQINNLEAQRENIIAQTAATYANAQRTGFINEQLGAEKPYWAQNAFNKNQQNIHQTGILNWKEQLAGQDFSFRQAQTRKLSQDIEFNEKMNPLRLKGQGLTNDLRQTQNNMQSIGLSSSDPIYYRVIGQWLAPFLEKMQKGIHSFAK